MGLFDRIFKRPKPVDPGGFFRSFTAYSPTFTSWDGGMYESALVRSAINARATHISKLTLVAQAQGEVPDRLARIAAAPNEWQTWGQTLYRISTILDVQNTAFLVPLLDRYGDTVGIYPVLPTQCQVVEADGDVWLRYQFRTGLTGSMELSRCGVLTKYQYDDDFFGADNRPLIPTLDLIHTQNQGIAEGVKNSATFRFMARVGNFSKDSDLAKERKRFSRENLQGEGGILLFPNTYSDIQQIKSNPFVVDSAQMAAIENNVYHYFGVNADVLQNKAYGDAWSAFYEGAIEPFAIQLSDVLNRMILTPAERAAGCLLMATANRLQYMSNTDKLRVSAQMADRGIMNRDEIREIWNLPPLPNGEGKAYTIRGEYYLLGQEDKEGETNDQQ